MGGGPEYIVPRKSMRLLGGDNPKYWRRNFVIYTCIFMPAVSYWVYRFGKSREIIVTPTWDIAGDKGPDEGYLKKVAEEEKLRKEKPYWTRFLSDGHK